MSKYILAVGVIGAGFVVAAAASIPAEDAEVQIGPFLTFRKVLRVGLADLLNRSSTCW
jgi:hypothetical protein